MALLVLLCAMLVTGCASRKSATSHQGMQQAIEPVPPQFFDPFFPSPTVTVSPGDEIRVRFYYHPQLDSKQIVRPDGKIALTLLQGHYVSGKTPEEIQLELLAYYKNEFVNPVVTVEIEKRTESSVFVSGQVGSGGVKQLQSNFTIGQMLAQCAVIETDANLGSVVLVRKDGDKSYRVYLVDAEFENGAQRDIYLAPGDIIIVPRNTITIIGDFVQKFIRNLIPPQMSIYYGVTKELTD